MPLLSLRRVITATGLYALAAICAGAPVSGFSPADVSDGPLLCLIHPEDDAGHSVSSNGPRTEVMYMCDPVAAIKARPVWRGTVPVPQPWHRLTRNLAVIERDQQCFVWDIARGSATPFWPGTDQTTFVKSVGTTIFFLHRTRPDPVRGVTLKTGKNGKNIVESWFRPRDRLCTLTAGTVAEPTVLTAPALEKVLESGTDGTWAVTADQPRKLCLISGEGNVTDVLPFDSRWVASETHHSFSPARDYLALSILHDQQDFNRERELVVL